MLMEKNEKANTRSAIVRHAHTGMANKAINRRTSSVAAVKKPIRTAMLIATLAGSEKFNFTPSMLK